MTLRGIAHINDLRLDFAAPFGCHRAGDTIIGEVIRKSPIVAAEATLKVWLTGIMEIPTLNGDPEQWVLLNPKEQPIFSGPLHLAENRSGEEPLTWSFSVPIPTKPWANVTRGHQPRSSFVPFDDKDHPAFHILPGSFRANCRSEEAMIEYRLHARLDYTRGGAKKSHYATAPIPLRHTLDNTDTDQLGISKGVLSYPTRVRSRRLLPGTQKTKRFFGLSQLPEFWFKILIASPPVVRFIDREFINPDPLPISLSIKILKGNDFGRTSRCIEDIPQQIQINFVKIRIKSSTTVIDGGNSSYNPSSNHFNVDFHFEDVFKHLENPLVIDSAASTPINLGNMFQLVLRKDGLYANGRRCSSAQALYPDFSTFAIKHTHQFDYRINLRVAGETLEVKVIAPVKIIEVA